MGRDDRERAGAWVVLVMLVVLAVLFGGGYVAAYSASQHKIPHGTRVAGIDVGGRSILAAAAALRAGLSPRIDAPVTLEVGGERQKVAPAEVGLGIDYVASVQQAGAGDGWAPGRLWNYYTGGSSLDPVVTVEQMTMADFLARLAATSSVQGRDGVVRFANQRVEVVKPRAGRTIDPGQAQQAITQAYLSADRTAHLDLVPSAPDIDEADVHEAVQTFANPAMSAPVALDLAGRSVRLQPRDFAAALSMRAVDGKLEPHVRAGLLVSLVHQAMVGHGRPADARVAMVRGRPQVVPAQVGVSFEPASVVAAFTAALMLPEGQRVAPVDVELHQPALTTQDAQALGVERRVAVYSTSYAAHQAGPDLTRAVAALDGALVLPGHTFSWSDVAGSGYGAEALPVATALYNAAFEAGFGDVEHHSPATYAGRSPVGRQATVEDGADLRFSVDSPYGVLVEAKLTGASPGRPGTVKVVLWSTPAWQVTSSTSARYNPVEPGSRVDAGAGCVPTAGRRGFDVDVTRHLHSLTDPAGDRDETVHTTYAPVDAVVCGP